MAIGEMISDLVAVGLFQYVLPFVLAFVVLYGLLDKFKIISEQKNINSITAIVLGLFVVYFARLFDVGNFLGFFISRSFLAIVAIMFALMISVFLYHTLNNNGLIDEKRKATWGLGIFTVSLVLIYLMINSTPDAWSILFGLETGIGSQVLETGIVFAVILFFLAWVFESQDVVK